jgi:undecaprenyl-diphosphatase
VSSSRGRVTGSLPPVLLTSAGTPPRGHLLVISALVTSVAFVLLAVLAHRVPYFPFDVAITRSVQRVDSPWITAPLKLLSAVGFPPLVDVVYGIIAGIIFLAGWRLEGFFAALAGFLGAVLNHLGKALVERPRPTEALVHVGHTIPNSTFPAGHVLNATMFFGFLYYVVSTHMEPTWRRTTLQALLLLVIVGMGIARIYSGEHWTSDVIGGYLLAWIGLVGTIAMYRGVRAVRTRRWLASLLRTRVPTTSTRL